MYTVEEILYGSEDYQKTVSLRDEVMRKPLGRSIENDDLSYEKEALIFGVFEGEKLLGVGIMHYKDESLAKIHFLCVDPALQKSGIGMQLIETMEARAKEDGKEVVYMEARMTAFGFYKKLGYQEYGETYLLKNVPIEHIKMEKNLR